MFKHILLPTDGSSLSQVAIQKGVQLAKSMKAKITGISVMPEQKHYLYQTDIIVQVKEETAKQLKLQSNRNLSVIEKAAKDAGVPCETLCEISDHPYETIIRVAEKRGCDLIISRGPKVLLLTGKRAKICRNNMEKWLSREFGNGKLIFGNPAVTSAANPGRTPAQSTATHWKHSGKPLQEPQMRQFLPPCLPRSPVPRTER